MDNWVNLGIGFCKVQRRAKSGIIFLLSDSHHICWMMCIDVYGCVWLVYLVRWYTQPGTFHGIAVYATCESLCLGIVLSNVVFSLHQMLSSDRCPRSIMRRDAGLPFSSLTVPHSKCIDRYRSYWHVQIDRPGLGDVSCNPRTTQEALCAHMLLALVRHTVPKSCSGNVQIVFLLDARKALGLILGLKYVFLVLLGSKKKRK